MMRARQRAKKAQERRSARTRHKDPRIDLGDALAAAGVAAGQEYAIVRDALGRRMVIKAGQWVTIDRNGTTFRCCGCDRQQTLQFRLAPAHRGKLIQVRIHE